MPRVPANDPDGRPEGTAIIADPRNDQTLIILQLHVAMQKFHNRLVDYMRASGMPRSAVFESARRLARWHYQWIVTHEFLPAIVGRPWRTRCTRKSSTGAPKITLKYYKPTNPAGRPFIPVEFAVAAYRFGHSITRPRYTVRDVFDSAGTSLAPSRACRCFRTQPTDNNLNGHRELLPRLKLQWSKFFNAAGKKPDCPAGAPVRRLAGRPAVQAALDGAARHQHSGSAVAAEPSPGQEDGPALGTAGGSADGRDPLTNAQLWTEPPHRGEDPDRRQRGEGPQASTTWRTRASRTLFADPEWRGEAPLWFYILKEAEIVGKGRELGPVGGRIVAEVLVGLLQKDLNSYLYLNPAWKPAPPIAPARGQFTMADLLKFAGVWS